MGNPNTAATSAGSDPAEEPELYRNRFSQWTYELIRPDRKASLTRFALQTMIRDEQLSGIVPIGFNGLSAKELATCKNACRDFEFPACRHTHSI
jgi:hypothetical protein